MKSVLGTPLAPCSEPGMPATGYARDGKCGWNQGDKGSHHVCLRDVRGFCAATGQPDWCADKEHWCVCEWAFETAVRNKGCDAFDVKCEATNQLALEHYERAGMTDAVACLQRQCGL